MTDVATIDHETRFERTWACHVGDQAYRVDAIVLPIANEEPPSWLHADLGALPHPDIALADWFIYNVGPFVAERACDLLSVKLTPIDADTFDALKAAHLPAPVVVLAEANADLTVEDFAGPNRAQRRGGRAMRRRPRR